MPREESAIITTRRLSRRFPGPRGEDIHAVRGIDLEVAPGETVAVLGPNGAGKSTLLRMLCTLLPPSGGTARVAGSDVVERPDSVRRAIGFVGQGNGASHSQRVLDEVTTQARIFGMRRADARQRAVEILDLLGLAGLSGRKTVEMSGGQRRRLDLAIGLVHAPRLLFLDEPTTGLDPQNRARLWEHLIDVREQTGMTTLITTHYLDEADRMADRIVVIDHGEIIADGEPERLRRELVGETVYLTLADAHDAARLADASRSLRGVDAIVQDGTALSLSCADARSALPAILAEAGEIGTRVTSAESRLATLDDVFLTLTGRSLRDHGDAPESEDAPLEVLA